MVITLGLRREKDGHNELCWCILGWPHTQAVCNEWPGYEARHAENKRRVMLIAFNL